jgi:hypothetical protein
VRLVIRMTFRASLPEAGWRIEFGIGIHLGGLVEENDRDLMLTASRSAVSPPLSYRSLKR